MPLNYTPMRSEDAARYRNGHPDAYGMVPEQHVSDGDGMPCRHCLRNIAAGAPYLLLAHRPFPALQPYAETGPIFLHAQACDAYSGDDDDLPPILKTSKDYILRGYDADDRIVYGTGAVIAQEDIEPRTAELFGRGDVAYIHVRSARNNCYQCRIDRA